MALRPASQVPPSNPPTRRGMAVVNERDLDADPNEYKRQLDDEQLATLAADVNRHTQALLAQGVPLPMPQIENHHVIGLLEMFIGRAKSLRVREWHLLWLARQLDEVEAQMRAHLLESSIFQQGSP